MKRWTAIRSAMLAAVLLTVCALCAAETGQLQRPAGAEMLPGPQGKPAPRTLLDNLFVENTYVRISAESGDGSFGIGTSETHPARPCQTLLYGFSCGGNSSTSHININVDGLVYSTLAIGCDGTLTHVSTAAVSGAIESQYALAEPPITVLVRHRPVELPGETGAILLETIVTNGDTVPHQIGVLYEFDTEVADNDSARLGAGGVWYDNETCFDNPEFTYWEAFEAGVPPTPMDLVGRGTLAGGTAVAPDRFAIGNWGNFVNVCWDYECAGDYYSDSGVLYWWNPIAVSPAGNRRVATYYGVGDVQITPGDLTISLSYTRELTCGEDGELTPNPFGITAYISNNTESPCLNVSAQLQLPDGLTTETPLIVALGDVQPGENQQAYWLVAALGQPCGQALPFAVSVTSDTCTANEAAGAVYVPCCGSATPTPSPQPWTSATPVATCLPLNADFTAISPALLGQAVQFLDLSTGEIRRWQWTFGDGVTAVGLDPRHIYQRTGEYLAQLRVTDRCGATDVHDFTVVVSDIPLAPPQVFVGHDELENLDVMAGLGWLCSWTPPPLPGERVVQYEVERRTSAEPGETWTQLGAVTATSWTESESFAVGTVVTYRVRTLTSGGILSPWSYSSGVVVAQPPLIERVDAYGADSGLPALTDSLGIELRLTRPTVDVTRIRISETPDFSGAEWIALDPGETAVPFTLAEQPDGLGKLFVQGGDSAAGLTPVLTTVVRLDTTAPVIDSFVLRDIDTGSPLLTDVPSVRVDYLAEGEARELSITEGPECEPGTWHELQPSSFTYSFTDASEGTKTLCMWIRDRAGNIAGPATAEIDYAADAPQLASITLADLSTGSVSYCNTPEVSVSLTTGAEESMNAGADVPCEIRIWEDDEQEPSGWAALPGVEFTYALRHTADGPHTVWVRLRDALRRESASARAGIILDQTAPIIFVAGHWDSYLSASSGGPWTMLAVVFEENVSAVDVLYEGQPTGLRLQDDGSSGDWVAGDTIYSLGLDLGPIGAALRLLLSLQVTDLAGNVSDVWPYLTVHPAPPATAAAQAAFDPTCLRQLAAELWTAAALSKGSWETPWTNAGLAALPQIMLAGLWDTQLSTTDGGTLTMLSLAGGDTVQVQLYYGDQPTGVLLYDDGQNGDFNPGDGVYGLTAPVAPGLPSGTWLWQLAGHSAAGISGDLFPYLTVHDINHPPSATIVNPAPGCYGSSVDLFGYGTDPDGDPVLLQWYDGAQLLGSGPSLTVQLTQGTHTIRLIAADTSAATGSAESVIAVDPPSLSVTVNSSVLSDGLPLTLAFQAQAAGGLPPYRYIWDFGDGERVEGPADIEHTYYNAGTFVTSVTVRDICGTEAAATADEGTAGDLPPLVTIILPSGQMQFTDRDAFHLLGQGVDPEDGQLPPFALSWDIDSIPLGMGRNIPVQFLSPDEHLVALSGSDTAANISTDSATISIGHWTPVSGAALSWDGSRATCRIELREMFSGEQIKWSWTKNGGAPFDQIFTASTDIPDLIIGQSYPYALASGDTVNVEISYLGGRWTTFYSEWEDVLEVP